MWKSQKARLGQHFLINKELIRFITEVSDLTRNDIVLEIGAGYGNLTSSLAKSSGTVIAVEKDLRLFRILSEKMVEYNNVKLLKGDMFSTNIPRFDKVVSSLPYYISSKFVKWLMKKNFKLSVLILQKEFASKLISEPGSRKYCKLTALVRHEMNVKILRYVSPAAFTPPPHVTSCIVKFNRTNHPYENDSDFQDFYENMVNYLFSTKRRLASSMVKKFIGSIDVASFDFNNDKRVFELSVEELDKLAKALYRIKRQ